MHFFSPKLTDNITVEVFCYETLQNGFYAIINRFGIIQSQALDCNSEDKCSFTIKPTRSMLPKATVWVFQILDEDQRIIGDRTDIYFENLSANHVSKIHYLFK